ncbi:hypothetical protein BXZ70DRAFT_944446 [Cristinia sonorae]|uniref:Uncharacterized protein n=1 Tax=Cristinia sonorae TaxID=1940300 RepID=A0A8K0UL71_9AGAR|nr:hypothetical protein BXZ70DRAFT_944446 [Cristinia sonorae]
MCLALLWALDRWLCVVLSCLFLTVGIWDTGMWADHFCWHMPQQHPPFGAIYDARELLGDRRAMIEMSLDSHNKSDIVIIEVTFPPHGIPS